MTADFSLGRERTIIALLCGLMVVKGILWGLAFPLWQGPDEDDHYAVIQFIAEMGRLPDVGDEVLPDDIVRSREIADVGRLDYNPEQRQPFTTGAMGGREAEFDTLPDSTRRSFDDGTVGKLMHATPLYYALATIPYHLFESGNLLERVWVQRIFASVMSAPLVLVAWLITRHFFPHDQRMRITIPFLVALHPMITEISSVVSVDGLFFVLYSAVLWLVLRILRDGLSRKLAVAVGILFAVGVLVKPTMNGIAPIVALAVLVDFVRRTGARWQIVKNALLMNVLIIVPVGWWMQRSLRLSDDLFYFNPVDKGHRIITNPFYEYPFWQHAADYWQSVWGGIFVTWWADFGWLDTPLPPVVYDGLRVLTIMAIIGLIIQIVRRPRLLKRPDAWLTALAVLFPIVLIQVYDLSFWQQYGVGRGLQGRYWLAMVVPMLLFWVVGLLAWLPQRWHGVAHQALRAGFVVFHFVSLLGYILPRYYL